MQHCSCGRRCWLVRAETPACEPHNAPDATTQAKHSIACIFKWSVIVFPHLACVGAGYTAVDPESRRIVPTDAERQGKTVVKMVYVVLEAQYQVGS
jgi:hypothetical protein